MPMPDEALFLDHCKNNAVPDQDRRWVVRAPAEVTIDPEDEAHPNILA
jgi:hypothetical protein